MHFYLKNSGNAGQAEDAGIMAWKAEKLETAQDDEPDKHRVKQNKSELRLVVAGKLTVWWRAVVNCKCCSSFNLSICRNAQFLFN